MTASALEEVPGLGDIRRKALLRRFGSVKRLGAASIEEIAEVPGIGRRTAEAILAALHPDAVSPEAPASPDTASPDAPPSPDVAGPGPATNPGAGPPADGAPLPAT
jgi:excinuclease ABC subunit C